MLDAGNTALLSDHLRLSDTSCMPFRCWVGERDRLDAAVSSADPERETSGKQVIPRTRLPQNSCVRFDMHKGHVFSAYLLDPRLVNYV